MSEGPARGKAGADSRAVGLCLTCRHSATVETDRSRFWRCTRAATDPRFDKYPRLPVLECWGHEPIEEPPAATEP